MDIHWICYLSESPNHYYTMVEYLLVPYQSVYTTSTFFNKNVINYPTLHDLIVRTTSMFQKNICYIYVKMS